eukprot:GHVO01030621.1.p1 GENE.GHVO01030621.1~~GHVO01030621.1.p1  ORF type:complete len:103 (+),score=0.75 GHVO01030621.1:136-444(+)
MASVCEYWICHANQRTCEVCCDHCIGLRKENIDPGAYHTVDTGTKDGDHAGYVRNLPSDCLKLNWINIQLVNNANAPRKAMIATAGTRPTRASEDDLLGWLG